MDWAISADQDISYYLLFVVCFTVLSADLYDDVAEFKILPAYFLLLHSPAQVHQIHELMTLTQTSTSHDEYHLVVISNQVRTFRLNNPTVLHIHTLIVHMHCVKNLPIIKPLALHTQVQLIIQPKEDPTFKLVL